MTWKNFDVSIPFQTGRVFGGTAPKGTVAQEVEGCNPPISAGFPRPPPAQNRDISQVIAGKQLKPPASLFVPEFITHCPAMP